MDKLEELAINTVRVLAADAVQKANSGHPGTPMGLAPIGHVLWGKIMNYNPKDPMWPARDRFVLSCGHACMLQYAYLYLTGYDIQLDDIKNFRQLHSITPGHPEYGLTPGIEVTTGPLGQGFANGVGMGIAQKMLSSKFNKKDLPVFDYNIYSICSDGDMMEGISSEAASIAGHLGLGNLVYIYDNNKITIEGSTALAFDEDVAMRFKSYGWHVQHVKDGNDLKAIETAILNGKQEKERPSLVIVDTVIGYGSPDKAGTASAHGAPLGVEEVRKVKENFGFNPDVSFEIPSDVIAYYQQIGNQGVEKQETWTKMWDNFSHHYPELAQTYNEAAAGELPGDWDIDLPSFEPSVKGMATRKASGKALAAIATYLPLLVGGAADLSPSTDTFMENLGSFSKENPLGRNLHFGIREHAMGAILNGITLTKGFIAFGATFLIFSDYMRPPMRLAAIMGIRPIYVFTHDSIGLGEDGTTHQPVEQLIGLRSVPNLTVIRPADANETAYAWKTAITHHDGPVALILTRQDIPILDQQHYAAACHLKRGAYILSDSFIKGQDPEIILMGSGSEVHLLIEAQAELFKVAIRARVVSFPSWELFDKQDQAYKEQVFPIRLRKRIAVEAGSSMGWRKYTGDEGVVIGLDHFGESAPGKELMHEFGFTAENVVQAAKSLLGRV
ncbi:transketolase [Arachidicoccus rhizosphaerae]|uniref:Transketolase n=1 Tax=Arachidicoccus rhizosphaerae TaxID=551991 RepID=A0A1H3YY86_9BACT|nr:transketolase [Arachidicoccus rhizosphaerae]SEA16465.1 transketolase [Arachidicoccus rhizosphaerae]